MVAGRSAAGTLLVSSPVSFSEYASTWLAASPGSPKHGDDIPRVAKNHSEAVVGRRRLY
jgi:hypothetical protein